MHFSIGHYPRSIGGQMNKINDVSVNVFTSLLYKTNRLHVAVLLFRNRSQKMSKEGNNIRETLT